jgi:hypothetical protein
VDGSARFETVATLAYAGRFSSTSSVVSAQSDYLPTNNLATTEVTAGFSDLAVAMSFGQQPVTASQVVTINVVVTNLGPDVATNLSVGIEPAANNDPESPANDIRNLQAVASTGTVFVTSREVFVSWFIPTLPVGGTASAQVTFVPALLLALPPSRMS